MTFQLGTPLLDACVLAVLTQGEAYGYVLTQNVRGVIEVSESTLYPVLRRLQKDGCLSTYDRPFQGRNRRYYAITGQGKERFEELITDWAEYKVRVDKVLFGGFEHE